VRRIFPVGNLPIASLAIVATALSGQDGAYAPSGGTLEPANAWMRAPFKLDTDSDRVPQALRAERDTYYDHAIGSPDRLSANSASRTHFSEGATFGYPPEVVPLDSVSAYVTGRFKDYRTVLSASGRSVYTEIHVSILRVVESGQAVQIAPPTEITVTIPGGTVERGNGEVISYLTDPTHYALRPAHSYLMLIKHQIDGDFYVVGHSWDTTNGIVEPNSIHDELRAKQGTSSLIGLGVDAAIAALRAKLH
jgi:hypothetical protein